MDIKERIEKFNTFLTNFEEASGATGLCEAVRDAAKVCFEGVEKDAPWMKECKLDPQYQNNCKASYKDIHRKLFHDIPKQKLAAKKATEKAEKDAGDDKGESESSKKND